MVTRKQMEQLIGEKGDVLASDGSVLGSIKRAYLGDHTGQPTWITVNTGMFGNAESFIPLQSATVAEKNIRVPYTRELVSNSPRMEHEEHLSPEEEQQLFRHYNLTGENTAVSTGTVGSINKKVRKGKGAGRKAAADTATVPAGTAGHADQNFRKSTKGADTVNNETVRNENPGPAADHVIVRSEEQPKVGTETRRSERVRIHKYVVTDNVQRTVTVRREEIRIEQLSGTGADSTPGADVDPVPAVAIDNSAFDNGSYTIVLHEERPVVRLETVAVEKIRLSKETIAGEETVRRDIRKEAIKTEGIDVVTGEGATKNTSVETPRS